mgnify:CR=1 FL=1
MTTSSQKFIIDTHILLWLLFSPQSIDKKIMVILEDTDNTIYVCSTTLWEISIKFHLGKLELNGLLPNQLPNMIKEMGFEILDINHQVMASLFELPSMEKHKDPFDRIMIWQCIQENYALLSQDGKFVNYQPFGLNLV